MPCPPLCQASSLQVARLDGHGGQGRCRAPQKVTQRGGPSWRRAKWEEPAGGGECSNLTPGDHRPSSFLTGDPAWTVRVPVCPRGTARVGPAGRGGHLSARGPGVGTSTGLEEKAGAPRRAGCPEREAEHCACPRPSAPAALEDALHPGHRKTSSHFRFQLPTLPTSRSHSWFQHHLPSCLWHSPNLSLRPSLWPPPPSPPPPTCGGHTVPPQPLPLQASRPAPTSCPAPAPAPGSHRAGPSVPTSGLARLLGPLYLACLPWDPRAHRHPALGGWLGPSSCSVLPLTEQRAEEPASIQRPGQRL